jgi:predicted ATPase
MTDPTILVLTGGPGGGKTTFIRELSADPAWRECFSALPEAISLMRDIGISASEKLFQRVMVHLQMALEEGLKRALEPQGDRFILCHRGSLDPLAYWLNNGWTEEEFFQYTETTLAQHYQRYHAVIHLVTAADGAEYSYQRWPASHRPETLEQAIRIDHLLQHAWGDHPHYYRIDNIGKDWQSKSLDIKRIISFLFEHR